MTKQKYDWSRNCVINNYDDGMIPSSSGIHRSNRSVMTNMWQYNLLRTKQLQVVRNSYKNW